MAEIKTKPTSQSAEEFLNNVEPEQKRQDSFALLKMFQDITGEKAVMWGESIVGFGLYHYKSERSRQEGDWPLTGFSPRKENLTLYVMAGNKDNQELLERLGKYKASGSCLYLKRLSDVDVTVLRKLIQHSFQYMKETNQEQPSF